MATKLAPPRFNVPMGTVRIGNQEMQVIATKAFWDYLCFELFNRVGGSEGMSSAELQASVEATQEFAEAEVRRKPLAPRPEDPIFRNSPSTRGMEMQLEELRAQVKAARAANDQLRFELDALRAAMPRQQSISAILQSIDELRAATS